MSKSGSGTAVAVGAVTKEQAGHEAPVSQGDGFWVVSHPDLGQELLYGPDARDLVVRSLIKEGDGEDKVDLSAGAECLLNGVREGIGNMLLNADLAYYEGLMLSSRPSVTEDEAIYLIVCHSGWAPHCGCEHPVALRQELYMTVHDQHQFEPNNVLDEAGVKALLAKILSWTDAEVVSAMHSIVAMCFSSRDYFSKSKLRTCFRIEDVPAKDDPTRM